MMGVKMPFEQGILLLTAQVELHVISPLNEQPSHQDKTLAVDVWLNHRYVHMYVGCVLY